MGDLRAAAGSDRGVRTAGSGEVETFSLDDAQDVLDRLARAGCVAADEEADELLTAAPDMTTLMAWVARRERGEPLAWITGRARFLGHELHVATGVFVPRAQTAELAIRAAELLPASGRAADLCTGCGAIAVHLASLRPGASVVGTDLDAVAAACARHNGVHAVVADMDAGLSSGVFDVVSAVTPYVPTDAMRLLPPDVTRYEPALALDGGKDGLDEVRRLVAGAARLLRRGGWLLTEIGGNQDASIGPEMRAAGFSRLTFWRDADADLRGVAAQLG